MAKKKTDKKLGLYIHIPFCRTICVYCAFPTYANKNALINEYLGALHKEIEHKGRDFSDYSIETIYFGGGTPSLLDTALIEQILATVKANFQADGVKEIGLEANPESLSAEKISQYRQMGINRLSIGIQSLNNRTLWKIARPHNQKTALDALSKLKKAGWKNFGCDLIIGLPFQTLASFKKDLRVVADSGTTHLSTYFLSHDTVKIDSFIADSPSEDEQIAMYKFTDQYLRKMGYNHYEVSNYAKPGFECRHNLRYWNRDEYLGLGLGAHSFINNEVSENTDNFDEYLANPLAPKERFKLENDLEIADSLMLSLRKNHGVNLENFCRCYGPQRTAQLLDKALSYKKTRHLKITDQYISPTLKGWLILDTITKDLI